MTTSTARRFQQHGRPAAVILVLVAAGPTYVLVGPATNDATVGTLLAMTTLAIGAVIWSTLRGLNRQSHDPDHALGQASLATPGNLRASGIAPTSGHRRRDHKPRERPPVAAMTRSRPVQPRRRGVRRDHRLMGRLIGVVVFVHGIAHLVGTANAVRAIGNGDGVEYAAGRWDIMSTTMLAVAATAWALVATGLAVTAIAVWVDTPRWPTALVALCVVSTIVCAIALPHTAIGLVGNAGLLAATVGLTTRRGVT